MAQLFNDSLFKRSTVVYDESNGATSVMAINLTSYFSTVMTLMGQIV